MLDFIANMMNYTLKMMNSGLNRRVRTTDGRTTKVTAGIEIAPLCSLCLFAASPAALGEREVAQTRVLYFVYRSGSAAPSAAAVAAPPSAATVAAASPVAPTPPASLSAAAAASTSPPAPAAGLLIPRRRHVRLVHLLHHLVRHAQVLDRVTADVHLRQPEELVAVLWAFRSSAQGRRVKTPRRNHRRA